LRLVALALVSVALVVAASAEAGGAAPVIKFVAVQVSQKESTNGFVLKDNDFVGSKKVGTDSLTCTVASQKKATCKIVVVRPAGTIRGTLVLIFAESQGKGTITGGTGTYAGAKGTLTFKNLNEEGTRTSVTITLV
jgi:hypothetical protein